MEEKKIILSIITPYYKALSYIKKLSEVLSPQLNSSVEWIIVDDGCNEKELDKFPATVVHLQENSGGASVPRNVALDMARGKYIAFIDSDDLVSNFYVSIILKTIPKNYDYFYISWSTNTHSVVIKDEPPTWNCCVWNCVYKRDLIGDTRFDPTLKMAEDYDFNKKVRKGYRGNVTEVLYYYNQNTPGSLSKQGVIYNNKFKR